MQIEQMFRLQMSYLLEPISTVYHYGPNDTIPLTTLK